ncbi:MAG: S-layer homology domain-containing protein [Caldicoprobacterales bacterium]|jgi:beta-N-acetylglucosaminidase
MRKTKVFLFAFLILVFLFTNAGQIYVYANEGSKTNNQDSNSDENIVRKEDLIRQTNEAYDQYKKIIDNASLRLNSAAEGKPYEAAIANSDGTFKSIERYSTFADAKSAMNEISDPNAVVRDNRRIIGNQVVAMKNGVIVITSDKRNKSILEFNYAGDPNATTYVENRIDAFYFDSSGDTVKMGISGQIVDGIPIDMVELVPLNQGLQSYYSKNSNGDLVHSIARYSYDSSKNRYIPKYESFIICEAPSFISTGKKYYSVDGTNFYEDNKLQKKVGSFYPYFKFLTFRSKTSYTAEELNRYIKSWNRPDSVLNGKGAAFIEAQNRFGVNAALLLAFAANESGLGTSKIAKDKNNLFGVNATDDNPYGNASSFKSVEESIFYQAEYMISRKYLDANTDSRYFGSCVGDKKVGLNVKYGSDPHWGKKIAGHMYRLDKFLGGKDKNKYLLAITNKITYAYKDKSTSSPAFYKYSNRRVNLPVGMPALILGGSGNWYELQSDMGIDSNRTTPARFDTIYNFSLSKAYGYKNYFTIINEPRRFIDVGSDHWAYKQIIELANNGIINGYGDGTFRPGDHITRAQAIVMIVNAMGIDYKGKVSDFKDVTEGHWAEQHIAAAKEAGIIKGYDDGTFRPGEYIQRGQIAVMIANAFKLEHKGSSSKTFSDIPDSHWAYKHIEILAGNGIINGYSDNTFRSGELTTRAQFSVILNNAMGK